MKTIVLTALLVLAFAGSAQAHRISTSHAESTWYSYFNWHCGNGGSWFCASRNAGLQCSPVYGAPHRNYCMYVFVEYPAGGNSRYCHLWGELLHTDVYYWREDC